MPETLFVQASRGALPNNTNSTVRIFHGKAHTTGSSRCIIRRIHVSCSGANTIVEIRGQYGNIYGTAMANNGQAITLDFNIILQNEQALDFYINENATTRENSEVTMTIQIEGTFISDRDYTSGYFELHNDYPIPQPRTQPHYDWVEDRVPQTNTRNHDTAYEAMLQQQILESRELARQLADARQRVPDNSRPAQTIDSIAQMISQLTEEQRQRLATRINPYAVTVTAPRAIERPEIVTAIDLPQPEIPENPRITGVIETMPPPKQKKENGEQGET